MVNGCWLLMVLAHRLFIQAFPRGVAEHGAARVECETALAVNGTLGHLGGTHGQLSTNMVVS